MKMLKQILAAMRVLLKAVALVVMVAATACNKDADSVAEKAMRDVTKVFELHEAAGIKYREISSANKDNRIITSQLAEWLRLEQEVRKVYDEENEIRIVHTNGIESYLLLLEQNDSQDMRVRSGTSITTKESEIILQNPVNTDTPENRVYNAAIDNAIEDLNVLIWAPFVSQPRGYEFGLAEIPVLQDMLEESNIDFSDPIVYRDIRCTRESLLDMTNFGIVLLATHGLRLADGFFTGEPANPMKITKEDASDISNKLYTIGTLFSKDPYICVAFWVIRTNFIKSLKGIFPKSIIINNSCHSAALEERLPEAFLSKGARTYLGYSNEVDGVVCIAKTREFFSALTGPELKKTGDAYIRDLYIRISLPNPLRTVLCSYLMYGSDEMRFYVEEEESEDWVMINGVKWATRNVGAPGTFVQNPEDYGSFYQWNRGTTDWLTPDVYYESVHVNSSTWLPVNDPSPAGYRVPTSAEMESLLNTTSSWTTRNGINGRIFTDRASGKIIFLPAATCGYISGKSICVGNYWNNTSYYSDYGRTYHGNLMAFSLDTIIVFIGAADANVISLRSVVK